VSATISNHCRLIAANGIKVFQIETTLNSETFPSQLGFLNKREWEWSTKDQALMMAAKKGNAVAPPRVRREFFRRIEASYKVTGVNAGEVEAVHERTLANLHRQQLVEVNGQSDVPEEFVGPYLEVRALLHAYRAAWVEPSPKGGGELLWQDEAQALADHTVDRDVDETIADLPLWSGAAEERSTA